MLLQTLRFPAPLAALVQRLPTLPPSFVLSRLLNLALRRSIHRQDFHALYGKHIAIRVSDIGLACHFSVSDGGFRAIRGSATPDLAITASAHDFYLLARRQEDPDALFFSRRLLVEGNTELGLIAKNTLDGIELPRPSLAMLSPSAVLARMKTGMTEKLKM